MARSEPESTLRKPLTAMLGVDSNLGVLRALVLHGGLLAASEIVRSSGLSRESVRLALVSLETLDLVISSGSSHSRVYRFNERHFLAPQLAALFEAESGHFEAIQNSIRRSAAGLPFVSLFLYGSVARGIDRPDSDVDIGVVALPEHLAPALETLREILAKPAEQLSFRPNVVGLDPGDLLRLEADKDPWWMSVRESAITLVGRRPEELIHGTGTVDG